MKIPHALATKIPENNRLERIWKLAQVDFKKRYYNDRLGLVWALLNPLFRVSVYYLAFNYLLGRSRIGVDNFALFLFSALIFWMALVAMIRKGMKVYIQKKYLIENIRVNVVDLYISHGVASGLGLMFNLFAYFIAAAAFGATISIHAIWVIPILLATLLLAATGISMVLTIVYINFRDINHLLDMVILLGFWTSGVIIPLDKIVEKYPIIEYLNPMIPFFYNVRAVLVYGTTPNFTALIISLIISMLIFALASILINIFAPKLYENI